MQGTEQWHIDRLGKVTASRVADVMARTKSGPAASRKNYMAELVAERLTGTWQEGFISGPILWGKENEPLARAEYEIMEGIEVYQVDFIDSPDIPMFPEATSDSVRENWSSCLLLLLVVADKGGK